MERERSLKGLFIKYLISWLAGSVLLAVIGFVMMSLAMQRGLIYPANHGDTEYEQEKESLKNAEKIRAEDIPPLMAYAEKAWEVSHRGYTGLGRDFYRVVERDGEVLVLRYTMKAQFTNPKLRKYLPAAEEMIYGIILLEILAYLMFMAVRFGKMLENKMNGIQYAIEKIEQEDL